LLAATYRPDAKPSDAEPEVEIDLIVDSEGEEES
jgi:hypothetical protein